VEKLSAVRDSLNGFSSINWIAAKHEAQSSEAVHRSIHPASYVNAVTGKSNLVIIYGLDLDRLEFMEALRGRIESLGVSVLILRGGRLTE
jgi:hypothetical protein